MSEVVLVTGSSRGIGKAIVLALAADGYDIVVHNRTNQKQAEEVAAQVTDMGQQVRVLQFDISNREQCKRVLEDDMEKFGAYYGVVCNAGIAKDNAFPAIPAEEWDAVIRTNLDGFYNVLHPVIMPMIRRRKSSRIVTLSSVSGEVGNRGQVNYSAAKAGIIGATKALAVELAKRKITVNCVAPGLIDTDMADTVFLDDAVKMIPMQRVGRVEEVAATVSFLMSEGASYITRQVISVNGGMV